MTECTDQSARISNHIKDYLNDQLVAPDDSQSKKSNSFIRGA